MSRAVKTMQQSSETIGAIAAALAKAQAELVNPEKSLTATIAGPTGPRSFRYASLATGLEHIRLSLSKQQIAAMQSTQLDEKAGLVRLRTTLAHASGEWISSEWPVCRVSDMGAPHRMGAALTYARRYALFALVGIAGEDDLDAPDLTIAPAVPEKDMSGPANPVRMSEPPGNAVKRKPALANPVLSPSQSDNLRTALVEEVANTATAEKLMAWAFHRMKSKNQLNAEDARAVEEAFRTRVNQFTGDPDIAPAAPGKDAEAPDVLRAKEKRIPAAPESRKLQLRRNKNALREATFKIDKSVLTIGEPKRHRNKEHLRFVAGQACLICGREPSDPHHLRFAQPRALGRKVSDEYVVPLCRTHHRQVHKQGNEQVWWKQFALDPLGKAAALWARSRSVHPPEAANGRDPTPEAST
jgi:hypothetical protein